MMTGARTTPQITSAAMADASTTKKAMLLPTNAARLRSPRRQTVTAASTT